MTTTVNIPIKDRLQYLAVYLLPVGAALAFVQEGWLTWIPLTYSFVAIPLFELIFPKRVANDSDELSSAKANDAWFDLILVLLVPIQYAMGIWFLFSVSEPGLDAITIAGRITAYGIMCGVIGINVAHELGHRPNKFHQFLAKALLLTSQYTHFFIEHNRGHHKHVATPEDPSTARLNEPLFFFWLRSCSQTWLSAWRLEFSRLKRAKKGKWGISNQMMQFTALQLSVVLIIYFTFGGWVLVFYLLAAIMGFLLLETVNYIEHYGLRREKVSEYRYEDAGPEHSWNSDHVIGRALLFELSRHSDHHYKPAKKYPTLQHLDASPQMPTGYPGMMIMAFIPPLWFRIMNKRVVHYSMKPELSQTDTGVEVN